MPRPAAVFVRRCGAARALGSGFSLIELMVALAVAGILFFIALPGYQYALVKSGRMAARVALLDVMARQEQYFASNKRYALTLDGLGLPAPYHVDGQVEAVAPAVAAYQVDLDLQEGRYVGATAVPVNRQAEDSACMAFSLSSTGVKAVSGTLSANPADCW